MQYQMPPELTKEERAMLNELPPLPTPAYGWSCDYYEGWRYDEFPEDRWHELNLFTAAQMHAYALAERERCARIVETTPAEAFCTVMHQAQLLKARETFAAAIRSGKP